MQSKFQKKPLMIITFQLDVKAELEIKIYSTKTLKKDVFDFIQGQSGINKRVKQKIYERVLKFANQHTQKSKLTTTKSFKSINEDRQQIDRKATLQRVQTCSNFDFQRRRTITSQDANFAKLSQPRSSLLSIRNRQKPQTPIRFQTLKCNTMKRANTEIDKNQLLKSSNNCSLNNINKSKVALEDLSSVLTSSDQGDDNSESKATLKNDFITEHQTRPGTQKIIEQRAIKTSKQKIFSKLKPIKVKTIRQKTPNYRVQNDITFRNNASNAQNIMLKNHDVQLQSKLIQLHKQYPQLFQELEILFMKLDNKNLKYINQQNLDLRNLNQKELRIVESIFLDIFSLKQNENMYIEDFMDSFLKKNNLHL